MPSSKGLEWTFDTEAKLYEKMRPSYPPELYDDIFKATTLDSSSTAVEVGIGGGQATQPILETGCKVTGVEYGKNFTELCSRKFGQYKNFSAVNMKFEDYVCECSSCDLIYSATAFHWIPEEIGYPKVYDMLKNGGVFARFANHPYSDIGREEMSEKIQRLYEIYMPRPKKPARYTAEQAANTAEIARKYGFTDIDYKLCERTRSFTAREYIQLINTYSDHIALPDTVRKEFYSKIEQVINDYGGRITIYDTIDMQLAKKP